MLGAAGSRAAGAWVGDSRAGPRSRRGGGQPGWSSQPPGGGGVVGPWTEMGPVLSSPRGGSGAWARARAWAWARARARDSQAGPHSRLRCESSKAGSSRGGGSACPATVDLGNEPRNNLTMQPPVESVSQSHASSRSPNKISCFTQNCSGHFTSRYPSCSPQSALLRL